MNGDGDRANRPTRLDQLGIILSSVCLVHCIVFPIIIAALPAIATSLPADQWVHPVLLATALPVTGFALWRGFRAHGDSRSSWLGALGLVLIAVALLSGVGFLVETVLTVLGGLLVTSAHIFNWRTHRNLHGQEVLGRNNLRSRLPAGHICPHTLAP